MKSKALIVSDINRVEAGEIDIPRPGDEDVLIETTYSLVSPGTELRCMAGKQDGCIFPYVPGYSTVGTVVEAGSKSAVKTGTRVFCVGTDQCVGINKTWGGHVQYAVQPATAVYSVPDRVDFLDASAAKLAAIAHRGARLSQPMAYEKVVVVGLGPIGQLSARMHAISGADVLGLDLSGERVEILKAAGIAGAVPTEGLAECSRSVFPGGADIVVDSTGADRVFRQVFSLAKDVPWRTAAPWRGARVVMQGSYPGDVAFDYHDAFRKEVSIHVPRDCQPVDILSALSLLERGKLTVRELISEVHNPEDAAKAFAPLLAGKGATMTVAFRWKA